MNTDTNNIIIYSLIILAVILIAVIIRLEIRIKKLMRGKSANSLEDAFNSMQSDISGLHNFEEDMKNYLTDVEKRLRRSVQAVETIRYNPFKGTGSGGNQSFATSLISEEGNGVVISSLYSREHVSVFSKPVKAHKSEFDLTEEELEVLKNAKESLGK
jgi:hypothetical protein